MANKPAINPAKYGFRHTAVHFGMFDYEVLCLVGRMDRLVEYCRLYFDDPTFEIQHQVRACHVARRPYAPIIWLPRVPRSPKDIGSLAHEITHTLRAMLVEWAGIPLNYDTDEIFCYAAGHAMTGILEGLRNGGR